VASNDRLILALRPSPQAVEPRHVSRWQVAAYFVPRDHVIAVYVQRSEFLGERPHTPFKLKRARRNIRPEVELNCAEIGLVGCHLAALSVRSESRSQRLQRVLFAGADTACHDTTAQIRRIVWLCVAIQQSRERQMEVVTQQKVQQRLDHVAELAPHHTRVANEQLEWIGCLHWQPARDASLIVAHVVEKSVVHQHQVSQYLESQPLNHKLIQMYIFLWM